MEKAGDIIKGELNAGDTEVILCKGGIRDWDEETIPQEVDRIIHCACVRPDRAKVEVDERGID